MAKVSFDHRSRSLFGAPRQLLECPDTPDVVYNEITRAIEGIGNIVACRRSPTRKAAVSEASGKHFSPTQRREFSPTKKVKLALVKPSKTGQRGRPRNPESPPAPGKYFYWTKARNGLKLEKRKPEYEYIGFIMPNEWEHLRGNFDEEYILRAVIAAIRIKRARAAESRRPRALTA